MVLKPPRGMADHRLQRSGLGKKMARPWYDFQRLRSLQPRERLLVELDDAEIDATDDQKSARELCRVPYQRGRGARRAETIAPTR